MTINNELYHHGVKGMHWGVRKDRFKQTVNKTMGSFLGIENKHLNKALRSSGKLRKAYLNAQMLGIKSKNGKYKFTNKAENKELYQKQQAAARKAQRYAKDFLNKYGNKPMSYLESINAQKGAAIGTAAGIAVPIILPLWATIPAGYYIGSHVGSNKMKHSEELMHYGVKGMRWNKHLMAHEDPKSSGTRRVPRDINISDLLDKGSEYVKNKVEDQVNAVEESVNKHGTVIQQQMANGHYGVAWGTALSAYRTDPAFRFAVDAKVGGTLSNLEKDEHWYNRAAGFLGRRGYSLASKTIGNGTTKTLTTNGTFDRDRYTRRHK